jgi:hypothetical protein
VSRSRRGGGPAEVLPHLRAWRSRQAGEQLAAGTAWSNDFLDLVFRTEAGVPIAHGAELLGDTVAVVEFTYSHILRPKYETTPSSPPCSNGRSRRLGLTGGESASMASSSPTNTDNRQRC